MPLFAAAVLMAAKSVVCLAQTAPPEFTAAYREGSKHFESGQLDQAHTSFRKALEIARAKEYASGEASTHSFLARLYNRRAEYKSALAEIALAMAIYRKLGDRFGIGTAYNTMGAAALRLGDSAQASDAFRNALSEFEALKNVKAQVSVLLNLSTAAPRKEKRMWLDKGLALSAQLNDNALQGSFETHLGNIDLSEGNYGGALDHFQQAVALYRKANATFSMANAINSLGVAHAIQGNNERAIEIYRRALEMREKLDDRRGIMQTLANLGIALHRLGRHGQALEIRERSLELARKSGSASLVKANLIHVGYSLYQAGDSTKALHLLEEAAREQVKTPFDEFLWGNLSLVYKNLGRYPQALDAAERAVALGRESSAGDLFSALWRRAEVRRHLGQTEPALADIREALEFAERLRSRLTPQDFMRRGFTDYIRDLYSIAISLFYQAGRHEEGLEAAEKARARAFLDMLVERDSSGAAPAPSLEDLRDAGPSATSEQTTDEAEEPLDAVAPAMPFSAERMAEAATRLRSTVLAYWLNEDALFIWVVGPGGPVRPIRIASGSGRLRKLIDQMNFDSGETRGRPVRLRGGDTIAVGGAPKQVWRDLHRMLIEPVAGWLPKTSGSLLTIIPHGTLFQVPFAALMDSRGRYLIEDYALHYVPAGALLEYTAKKKAEALKRPQRFLIVASPANLPPGADGKALPPLPGSLREAKRVARLMSPGDVILLAGDHATENRVRDLAAEVSVAHFATHGVLLDRRPFDSFLALAGGALTAREIYGLRLDAQLVVLSACRTALGRVSGDGILGLTRAFFYAGTPSVVATLWDVADDPTALLLEEFYRVRRRTNNNSGSLRSAQMALIEALRAGRVKAATSAGPIPLPEHPMFWAGFVLQGEP